MGDELTELMDDAVNGDIYQRGEAAPELADELKRKDAEIARLREALERRDDLLSRARSEVRTLSIELQSPPDDEELLTDIQREWRDHPCDAHSTLQGGDDGAL